ASSLRHTPKRAGMVRHAITSVSSWPNSISARGGPGAGASGLGGGRADRFEADVVDPHLADLGAAADAEVQGERGGLALGAEDPLDLDPAADGGEHVLVGAVGEDLPGGRGVLVLGDPGAAFALGAGGDQVPEPQPHLRAVADGPLGEPVVL